MTEGMKVHGALTSFNTLDLPLRWADVLVIGSGVAGLRAAIEAAKTGTVILVTKCGLMDSNTRFAQGGIAAAIDRIEKSYLSHIEDTLSCGAGICNEPVVDFVVREGAELVAQLMEWGTNFDVDAEGELCLGLEGGHSKNRVLHSNGDSTGHEIARSLVAKAQACRQIRILEDTFTIDLIRQSGECRGAVVWDHVRGKQVILARATILCSGGAGRVFRETTNPAVATGDGVAMAYRAGLPIQDAEFFQFHPTTLYVAGAARALISEAVRGEGAHLVDREGDRFMLGRHPKAELAPRDVVARSILEVMKTSGDTHVFLDLSPIKGDVRARFPGIDRLCRSYGLDLDGDRIPVRPSAHYWIGGVATDEQGATALPRLYAAGEVACTGLHGANRLASNSLLEGLVFGARAGAAAAELATGNIGEVRPLGIELDLDQRRSSADLDVNDLKHSLCSLMTRSVGIVRSAEHLEEAVRQIEFWGRYVLSTELAGPRGWETQNLITVAWLIASGALSRKESRGTHFRSDFPERSPEAEHSCRTRSQ